MHFLHSPDIWRDFPELVAGVVFTDGITSSPSVDSRIATFTAIADRRLSAHTEAEMPEIQAWRRAFTRMGLKPTQHRCAAESLLRRYRRSGDLPRIHPLVDLCNAISLAHAIPIAVFDLAQVVFPLEVRYAEGNETFLTLGGQVEQPEPREVIFADPAGRAHARRWTSHQSGLSAVSGSTRSVLIVAEAMHLTAQHEIRELVSQVGEELLRVWHAPSTHAVLSASSPQFVIGACQ
jgi:DNA/RNA-binding domain of Phe-tRNA-synthetase-like protein